MAVNYKFKSAKDFDSVAIDGECISIAKLKEKIVLKQKLGRATDFDLVISNADTDEEYLAEDFLVYDNASVLVRRVPRAPPRARISSATRAEWEAELGELEDAETVAAQISEGLHVQAASSCISSDEDEKIKEFVDSSAAEWMRQTQESQLKGASYQRKPPPTKVPPLGYVCFRCGVAGHFIQDCPTNGDPLYDVKKMKLPSGIPRTMLVANPDGSYALPSGEVAEMKPNEDAFAKEIDAVLPVEPVTEIPPELRCPMCNNVLKDAVLTSKCCFKSYCDKCIRDVLLEKCTCVCGAKKIYADDLLPNMTLRQTIDRLLSGPALPTTNIISDKPQSQDSTTTQVTSSATKETSADNKKVEVNEENEELEELEEVDYDDEGFDDLNLDALEGEESEKTPESTVAKAPEAKEQKSPEEAKESSEEPTSVPDTQMEVVNATKPANGSPERGKAGSQARGSVPPYSVHYTGYWSASHMIGELCRPRYGLNAYFPRMPFSASGHYPYQAYAGNRAHDRLMSREEFEARKAILKRKRGFTGRSGFQSELRKGRRDETDKDSRDHRSGSPYRQRSRSPLRHRPRSNSPRTRRRDSGSPRRRSASPPRRSMSSVRRRSSYIPARGRLSPNSRSPQRQSQYRDADNRSPERHPRFREKASPQRYPPRYSSKVESREDKENTWRRAANGRYPDGYSAKAGRISPRRRDYEPEREQDKVLLVERVPGKDWRRSQLQSGYMSPEPQPGLNFGIRVRPDDRDEEPVRQVIRKPVQWQEMPERYEGWDHPASASDRYEVRNSVSRLGRPEILQQKRAGYADSYENDAYKCRIQVVEETERPTRTLLRGARSVSDCDDLEGFLDDRMVAPSRGAGFERSMVLLPPRDDDLMPPPLLREQRLRKTVFRRPDGPAKFYSTVEEDDEEDEMFVVERAALMEQQQQTAVSVSRRKPVKRVSLVKDRLTVQVGENKPLLMKGVDNIVVQKRPRTAVFLNSGDGEDEQEDYQQKQQIQQPVVQANLIVNRAKRLKAAATTAPGGVKLTTKNKLCKISPMVKSVFERISFNTTPNKKKKGFKAGGGGGVGNGGSSGANASAQQRMVVFYGDMS